MDEKLKKTLKTSKQGAWLILILAVAVNVIVALTAKSIGTYLQNSWASIIYMAGLITGLVLYSKEKYTTGAEIIQWSALGNIIVTFANVIITCIITGVFAIEIKQLITLLIGIIVSIILIVEALKVIRLTEQPGHVNKVTVPAIIIIAVVIIINIVIAVQVKQEVDDILDEIKDQINNEVVNKDDNAEINNDTDNNQGEINNEEVVDPYANYKDTKWADKSSKDTEIKNDKLYFLNKEVKLNIKGSLKSVETIIVGGFPTIYVVTSENEAWFIALDDIVNNTVSVSKRLLPKEKVVDMVALKTYTSNYSDTTVYFLTQTGKLIDENNVSYDKYNFVDSYHDVTKDMYISFDKDLNGYYYNSKNNTYTAIVSKSTGARLAFSKLYSASQKILIVTAYNKLFEYNGTSNKATQIPGEVSNVKKIVDGEKIDLLITFKDGSTKLVERADYAYDVKNKKEITLASLATFDPYANYKKHVWNTSTKVDTTVGNIIEIKSGKLYSTDTINGNKTTQITGIVGTPKKLKFTILGGAAAVYVLTDKGIIYLVDGGGIIAKTADLSQYNVIDMTIIDNHGQEYNYYLTADGKLIDKNGVSYSETKFVDSFSLNIVTKISIDKNFVGFSYDGKKYSEIQDETTGKGIKISKIYPVKSYDVAIIVSLDNKVYEYNGESNKATLVGELNAVERTEDVDNRLILKVKLKDGTAKWYENCAEEGYDVVNKQNIDINKLKRAEPAG